MSQPDPKPEPTGPVMYVVPAWMALFGAALVVTAVFMLVWDSPAVGIIAVLSLVAMLLAALGATPDSVQQRIGRMRGAHPDAWPAPTQAPTAAMVGAATIRGTLAPFDIEYDGPALLTTAIADMAEHYSHADDDISHQAADALRALIERADKAYAAAARRRVTA